MSAVFEVDDSKIRARRERERQLSRRRLLIGGACTVGVVVGGGALASAGLLPGGTRLRRALGLDGEDGTIPDVPPGPAALGSFQSEHRKQLTRWAVSYPPGSKVGARLPVLVSLHGKGGTAGTSFQSLGLDRFLAAAIATGTAPFAIAAVDGGNTYWHHRDDGTDSGAMVLDELLPILADRGLDTRRLGLFGWSMGGYGALHLATRSMVPAVRSVSTMSAALWTDDHDTARGAFDDEADFAADDVFEQRRSLGSIPMRMDCGTDDPFAGANREFRDGLATEPAGGFQRGAHSLGYWRRMAPAHIEFAAHHLTSSP
ncbi:alpha/beta hydrolase [Aquihabitans sp. McL0605]|uniref:alpha/beta hydrolase n=1 Tax=Aquihabitans sp. McL0605 TaxID=3415671 RepID=UPI003CF8F778